MGKISRAECIRNIADGINAAHQRTAGSKVRVVLENMSCQVLSVVRYCQLSGIRTAGC